VPPLDEVLLEEAPPLEDAPLLEEDGVPEVDEVGLVPDVLTPPQAQDRSAKRALVLLLRMTRLRFRCPMSRSPPKDPDL
jgi:hypothetical protein